VADTEKKTWEFEADRSSGQAKEETGGNDSVVSKAKQGEHKQAQQNVDSSSSGSEAVHQESGSNPNQVQPGSEPQQHDSAPPVIEMAEPRKSYKVLVVDDDKWIQKIFRQYLSLWGFTHVEAMTGTDGLKKAMDEDVVAIFLDIVLPDVYGDIVLKFIKAYEESKDPPVVIVSSSISKNLIRQTYGDGASGFVMKPFSKEVLQEKIRTVVDRSIIARMKHDGVLTFEN
jgi:CheY-like chemotaxis protein